MHISKYCVRLPMNVFNFSHRCISVQNSLNHSQVYDVVISGGGLVGCALACALGSSSIFSDKKVLLLESSKKTEFDIDPEVYSNRVCAINPGTKSFFEELNLWDKMCNIRVKEVKKMKIWESCSDASLVFQYPDMKNNVAYIVENNVMLRTLNQRLADLQNNIHVSRGVNATAYNLPSEENRFSQLVGIKLDNGQEIQTKLLIGADGVNSNVRKTMGVRYINFDYNQKGIVATVKLAEPTENVVAWQRFLPSGPIALLPLTDDSCSLVWTVSRSMCDKLLRMSDEEFTDSLNACLWSEKHKNAVADSAISVFKASLSNLLPRHESVRQLPPSILSVQPNSRAAFPLALGHSSEYVVPRVALIGDAAHRVHPLAGQGVNLGFGDVQCLVKCLQDSLYNGDTIDAPDALQEYETLRQRHVVPTLMAIDGLNKIYGTEFTPIVVLRSLGVTLFDSVEWLKGKVMQHASS